MADFDFGEFLRQKRIQDAANAHDPAYNPDDATHWISTAQNLAAPEIPQSVVANQSVTQPINDSGQQNYQFPEFKSPEHPMQDKLQSVINQAPLKEDYHPSKLRQILAGVGGAAMGVVSGTPQAGFAMGSIIRNSPYNRKVGEYNQKLGQAEEAAKLESGNIAETGKLEHEHNQSIAERERAGAENARRQHEIYDTSQTAHDRKLEELHIQHPGSDTFFEAKTKDGKKIYLKRDNNGRLIDTERPGVAVSMDAIDQISDPNKSLKDTVQGRLPAALQGSISARQIVTEPDKYDKATVEAAQDYIDELHKGKDPTAAFGSIVEKTNAERKLAGKPEMSSSELTALQKTLQPVNGPWLVNPSDNTLFRGQNNQVLPPNTTTPQQSGAETTRKSKVIEEMEADKDFVNGYIERGAPNGPDDEALLERFFNATKPSTGFRMNQAQIKLLTNLRSLKSRIKAGVQHITGGTLFDDTQRKQIAQSINEIIDAKTRAMKGIVGAPVSNPDGWSVKVVK